MSAICRRSRPSFQDNRTLDLDRFDFELPDDAIALRPAEPRDSCKLLVPHPDGRMTDAVFSDIGEFLRPGDLLILNNTRVIRALIFGIRPARDEMSQDVAVQINLLEDKGDNVWACLGRPGRRLREGDVLNFNNELHAEIIAKQDGGRLELCFREEGEAFWTALDRLGRMPIPPYIAKFRQSDDQDQIDYQTVFAACAGSVAAPTAGLHFTDGLLESLKKVGVETAEVTLHVGAGTFAPLNEENIETGKLHHEWCEIPEATKLAIDTARANGGRVFAVGTTSLRTLESLADGQGGVRAERISTDIFIQPGYRFKVVDGLITNFHLPKSSLFMLVCALMGTEIMKHAYEHAVANGYRFYSYGDACLMIPSND